MKKENLALLCDFYEFTMSQGYFKQGLRDRICYFDVFFRKVPDGGAFAIFAGLEDILDFVSHLSFSEDDIEFLRKQELFDEDFLAFLSEFKFEGEIYAMCEGELVFANEPLMIIKARAIEAQLLETFLLCTINHQSLIATKANRIVRAAGNKPVLEFGARRAHGSQAALKGSKAAILGGCLSTSNTLACKLYGLRPSGTMAHSWVQMFESEYEAFKAYVRLYPKNPILLIDTYECFMGLENAIKVFKEEGVKEGGVRLDSGDLATLSVALRQRLDKAGLSHFKIVVSNGLDEYGIEALKDAPIDAFGVGERLITATPNAIFGGVYKLVASEEKGIIVPKIKISEDRQKSTTPHLKRVFRIYDEKGKALYDELFIYDEILPPPPLNCQRVELLRCVFKEGKPCVRVPSLEQSADFCRQQSLKFDEDLLKLKPKKNYKLVLSKRLKDLKKKLKTRF
ncbi:nicotinate phosphoribosyltransferase [Campylobacter sp. VTCC 70190]|uniref:nicotinate phosphoribosyltransferase n=1 Tax=Campylobacter sp. VTCC 70190 TaxID=3392118 RepID=UPI00398F0926